MWSEKQRRTTSTRLTARRDATCYPFANLSTDNGGFLHVTCAQSAFFPVFFVCLIVPSCLFLPLFPVVFNLPIVGSRCLSPPCRRGLSPGRRSLYRDRLNPSQGPVPPSLIFDCDYRHTDVLNIGLVRLRRFKTPCSLRRKVPTSLDTGSLETSLSTRLPSRHAAYWQRYTLAATAQQDVLRC